MKNESCLKMTELDAMTFAPQMQMIKAALPYMQAQEQRFLSLMIKASELERTIHLFQRRDGESLGICSLEEGAPDSPLDMLNAIKPYASEEDRDTIELIINFLQGAKLSRACHPAKDIKETNLSSLIERSPYMTKNDWRSDPRLKKMDEQKLTLLTSLAEHAGSLPKEKLIPLLMELSSQSSGAVFSEEETELLVSVLTANMSPAQKKQAETLRLLSAKLRK